MKDSADLQVQPKKRSRRGLWLFLAAVLGVFALLSRSPAKPEPAAEKPPEQIKFEALIAKWRDAYNAADDAYEEANDFEKSEISLKRTDMRKQRGAELCAEFPNGEVPDWRGTVEDVYPKDNGDAYLWVPVTEFLSFNTSGQYIPRQSKPYAVAAKLKKGDAVTFSGTIQRHLLSRTDCFYETSLTERGSMDAPDFDFEFTGVAVGAATSISPEISSKISPISPERSPEISPDPVCPGKTAETNGPKAIAESIIGKDKVKDLRVDVSGTKLRVIYVASYNYLMDVGCAPLLTESMCDYLRGASSFLLDAHHLFPALFEKCPSITEVEVVASSNFVDKRGHESVGDAIKMAFTRANGRTIVWEKVYPRDVPELADRYWTHPAMGSGIE